MVLTFLVYIHLIATCAAIGTIVMTDLRLIVKVLGNRVVIPSQSALKLRRFQLH